MPKRDQSGSSKRSDRTKRQTVRVACNACRTRKSACDAERPTCGPCRRRVTHCVYDTKHEDESRVHALRRENAALKRDLEELRKRLDTSAAINTQDLSDTLHPSSISKASVAMLQHGMGRYSLPNPLSDSQTIRRMSWMTESPLEFELTMQHPAAYPPIAPISNHQAVAESIFGLSELASPSQSSLLTPSDILPQRLPIDGVFCEDRLRRLDITHWTGVPISNDYAAAVISLYLETDHPLNGMFDADLFVGDLVNHRRGRYCSSLLVNALLYYESAYSVFNTTSSALSLLFLAEFNTLLQSDDTDSLLTVAALQIAVHGSAVNGFDKEGEKLRKRCHEMAKNLGLQGDAVGSPEPLNWTSFDEQHRFRAHIAWGYFAAATSYAFYYQQLPVQAPVALPIPGSPGFPLPSYMGQTFTALCRLWTICRDLMFSYNDPLDRRDATSRLSLSAVESKYQDLLTWADTLPEQCLWTADCPHHVETMHVWYHTAIVYLFRPWIGKGFALGSFSSTRFSPDDISKASVRQLKQLVLRFRSNVPQAKHHIYWHPALFYVANAVLVEPEDRDWNFFFLACLEGYKDLYSSFPIAAMCFKGLLTMAIETRRFSTEQARHQLHELEQRGKHHPSSSPMDSAVLLQLNFDSAKSHGTVDSLARKFEEVALFEETIRMDISDVEETYNEQISDQTLQAVELDETGLTDSDE